MWRTRSQWPWCLPFDHQILITLSFKVDVFAKFEDTLSRCIWGWQEWGRCKVIVTLTFDHKNLIRSSLSPGKRWCQKQTKKNIHKGILEISCSLEWDVNGHTDLDLWDMTHKILSCLTPSGCVLYMKKCLEGILEISCSQEWDGQATSSQLKSSRRLKKKKINKKKLYN